MLIRVFAVSVLVAGLALILLGAALFLNVLSLRELAASTQLSPAIWAVFEVRDEVSHRRAQGLELLVALVGVALIALATWWLQTRARGVRGGQ